MKSVYVVQNNDYGNYVKAIFTKREDAEKLLEVIRGHYKDSSLRCHYFVGEAGEAEVDNLEGIITEWERRVNLDCVIGCICCIN